MEEKTFNIEEYIEKFKSFSYTKKSLLVILWSVIIAVIGCMFMANWDTFEFGVFLTCLGGAIAAIALDYLIAKEFEFIATEKGYNGKRYFWYSFLTGMLGYLLVIALPNKK